MPLNLRADIGCLLAHGSIWSRAGLAGRNPSARLPAVPLRVVNWKTRNQIHTVVLDQEVIDIREARNAYEREDVEATGERRIRAIIRDEPRKRVIHIDNINALFPICLLYTSPSPRDRG